MVKRRTRRIDPKVYDEIHRQVRGGSRVGGGRFTNATELYRYLLQEFPAEAPSERTVRSIVKELTPSDSSGVWKPGPDVDPEEAELILSAIAECLRRWSDGSMYTISNDHARWLSWLLRGWPDLDPMVALVLSTDYMVRSEAGDSTEDLDGFLAFAPWRSIEIAAQWQKARDNGLPSPPLWYHTAVMAVVTKKQLDKERKDGQSEQKEAQGPR